MKTIAIVNQKGGVGKTTTAINLSAALSKLGKEVLVLDLDPQRNLSDTMGFVPDRTPTTTNELLYFTCNGMPVNFEQYIRHNDAENVDFIPATPALATAPTMLATVSDGARVLDMALTTLKSLLGSEHGYDYCIIDCKPSIDLLTKAALVAADSVIIPVEPEEYAVSGVADLLSTIETVKVQYNKPELHVEGILLTRCDNRRSNIIPIRDELIAALGDMIFETRIPYLKEASDAAKEQRSCVNAKGSRVGEAYKSLATEIAARG